MAPPRGRPARPATGSVPGRPPILSVSCLANWFSLANQLCSHSSAKARLSSRERSQKNNIESMEANADRFAGGLVITIIQQSGARQWTAPGSATSISRPTVEGLMGRSKAFSMRDPAQVEPAGATTRRYCQSVRSAIRYVREKLVRLLFMLLALLD